MEASFRTTCVLAVIAAGLSVWAWIFESGPAGDEQRGRVFPNLARSDVVAITLEIPGEAPVDLRYETPPAGGLPRWRIASPIEFDALVPRVDRILAGIEHLQNLAPAFVEKPEEVFGDGSLFARVRFTARGPIPGDHVIELGPDHPDESIRMLYARVDGGEAFLTASGAKKRFGVRLVDLRERAVFPVPKESAVEIEITRAEREPALIARAPGSQRWYVRNPYEGVANWELLANLLDDLNSWRIERFVTDSADDPARYGFDAPRLTIKLKDRRGEILRREIANDPRGELEDQLYLRDPAKPSIFVIAESELDGFERSPEEFRSRYLLQLGASSITEVRGTASVAGDGRTFRLYPRPEETKDEKRAEQRWRVYDEKLNATWEADSLESRSFRASLRRLEVLRYIDREPPPALKRVINDPGTRVLRLSLDVENFDRPVELAFHDLPQTEEFQRYDYLAIREPVAHDDQRELALITTPIPNQLRTGGMFFRNRQLATFSRSDIQRVTIHSRALDRTWELTQIEGIWTVRPEITDPDKSLDQFRVARVAGHLPGLRAEEFLRDESDLEKLELTRDRAGIAITMRYVTGIEGFKQLLVGPHRPRYGNYYALVDTIETPITIPSPVVKDFMELIADLDKMTARE